MRLFLVEFNFSELTKISAKNLYLTTKSNQIKYIKLDHVTKISIKRS